MIDNTELIRIVNRLSQNRSSNQVLTELFIKRLKKINEKLTTESKQNSRLLSNLINESDENIFSIIKLLKHSTNKVDNSSQYLVHYIREAWGK